MYIHKSTKEPEKQSTKPNEYTCLDYKFLCEKLGKLSIKSLVDFCRDSAYNLKPSMDVRDTFFDSGEAAYSAFMHISSNDEIWWDKLIYHAVESAWRYRYSDIALKSLLKRIEELER
jgi:hypothetical protein